MPESSAVHMDRQRKILGQSLPAQNLRWIAADDWHLTLRFLGDISEDNLAFLIDFLAESASICPCIQWTGSKFSYLPSSGRPKVLAIEGDVSPALSQLVSRLQSYAIAGAKPSQYTQFRPHVSLVRIGSSEQQLPIDIAGLSATPLSIRFTEMALYRSQLSVNGSIYDELGVWPLKGGE